jgi:acyl-CoA synthetase (AMP-forming)/AMP-acid ligase II
MWLELANAVKHWARYAPAKEAILTEHGTISYHELDAAADALVDRLAAIPIASSIRIALATATKVEFLIALVACRRYGARPVILNPYLSSDYLRQTIRDTSPGALLIDKHLITHDVLASYRRVVPSAVIEDTSLGGDARRPSVSPEVKDAALADEWGVLFSSGSTGVPKAIVHNCLSMTSEFLAWCFELELRRSSRFFVGRPLFYTGVVIPELEAELLAEEFAQDVAILPLQGEETTSFHVFVVPADPSTSTAALCRACLQALSIPIHIHGVTVLAEIPRLPSGKIDRAHLREMNGAA